MFYLIPWISRPAAVEADTDKEGSTRTTRSRSRTKSTIEIFTQKT